MRTLLFVVPVLMAALALGIAVATAVSNTPSVEIHEAEVGGPAPIAPGEKNQVIREVVFTSPHPDAMIFRIRAEIGLRVTHEEKSVYEWPKQGPRQYFWLELVDDNNNVLWIRALASPLIYHNSVRDVYDTDVSARASYETDTTRAIFDAYLDLPEAALTGAPHRFRLLGTVNKEWSGTVTYTKLKIWMIRQSQTPSPSPAFSG